jgi:hypothetical protein
MRWMNVTATRHPNHYRLLAATKSLTSIRLRIFVTSGPEIPIRCGFSQIPESERQVFVLHDILPEIVDRDLGRYFEHSFADIREEPGFADDWPGMQVMSAWLRFPVASSSGLRQRAVSLERADGSR